MAIIPPNGLYAPLPAFFNEQDELDLDSYKSHAKYVSSAGIIPVVSATIGEAVHLTREERVQLIQTAKTALIEINSTNTLPIVAGVGATSTRETIQLAKDAAQAGADFALVIAPGYFGAALKSNSTAIRRYFTDVASASPIPVIIYNYPVVAGGIDLDSDDIVAVAKSSSNIRGVMLSDGNVGKLARITAQLDSASFTTLAGLIDFLLPSVVVGSAGAISPLPNIAPRFSMKLWEATQVFGDPSTHQAAAKLQGLAALAEAVILKFGLPGLKSLLSQQFGYPSSPRLPLLAADDNVALQMTEIEHIKVIMGIERQLSS